MSILAPPQPAASRRVEHERFEKWVGESGRTLHQNYCASTRKRRPPSVTDNGIGVFPHPWATGAALAESQKVPKKCRQPPVFWENRAGVSSCLWDSSHSTMPRSLGYRCGQSSEGHKPRCRFADLHGQTACTTRFGSCRWRCSGTHTAGPPRQNCQNALPRGSTRLSHGARRPRTSAQGATFPEEAWASETSLFHKNAAESGANGEHWDVLWDSTMPPVRDLGGFASDRKAK